MGILADARPSIIICTRDRARSVAFYRDVLGLSVVNETGFASVLDAGGVRLRISPVPDFTPHEHTVAGFAVADVRATAAALTAAGVVFQRDDHFERDDLGVASLAGGRVHVAWFSDPDGNVLSLHDTPDS